MARGGPRHRRRARVLGRCFICKQGIEERGLDACRVVLVTNAYGPRDGQRERVFPCHLECFRRVLDEDVILEIANPEYPTKGDLRREHGDEPPEE